MNKKDFLFIVGIMVIVTAVCFGIGRMSVPKPPDVPMGGLVHNVLETFDEGIAVDGEIKISGSGSWLGAFGGDLTTVSVTDNDSQSAAIFCNSSVILRDPNGASRTDYMPTAAALIADCLPTIGDTLVMEIVNNADAAETITFDTQSNLMAFFGTRSIDQDQSATLTFVNFSLDAVNTASTQVAVFFNIRDRSY